MFSFIRFRESNRSHILISFLSAQKRCFFEMIRVLFKVQKFSNYCRARGGGREPGNFYFSIIFCHKQNPRQLSYCAGPCLKGLGYKHENVNRSTYFCILLIQGCKWESNFTRDRWIFPMESLRHELEWQRMLIALNKYRLVQFTSSSKINAKFVSISSLPSYDLFSWYCNASWKATFESLIIGGLSVTRHAN